ncbi:MAG TPA: hypothetical protein DD640_05090 [Clostridiales bacterium]|nr:hypothetical protein [Clostridiales bacterium]
MTFSIADWERDILKELAVKQAELASLPIMQERKKQWFNTNTGHGGTKPPVVIEEETFSYDFLPEGIFQCESELARKIERDIIQVIRSYELINDDKVVPDTYRMNWFIDVDEFGIEVPIVNAPGMNGKQVGYKFIHPIKDLKKDFHKLKPACISVNKEKTFAYKVFLEDLFAGALPVEIVCDGNYISSFLTNRVIALMGMEAFFMALCDYPSETHVLMEYLTQNALHIMRFFEREELLRPNNGNHASFGSSFNFTNLLPQPDRQKELLRLRDMWLSTNSQESVGISPDMFCEFCLPYYTRVCEQAGLIYYGCCEPVSPIWNKAISQLPNLKKVSISRWCDESYMGDALRGTDIVYSRKPDPNFLSVDVSLDEESWSAHIRKSIEAARGCQMEFIIRDVYTLHGNINNARRAVELARKQIDQYDWQ